MKVSKFSVALNSTLTFSESLGSQARCLQGQPICSQWMNNSIDKEILLLMVCQGQILRIRKGSRYWWLLKEGTKEVLAQRTSLCWIWAEVRDSPRFHPCLKYRPCCLSLCFGLSKVWGDSNSCRYSGCLQGTSSLSANARLNENWHNFSVCFLERVKIIKCCCEFLQGRHMLLCHCRNISSLV